MIVSPSGIRALDALDSDSLAPEHVQVLLAEKADIDMLLIGTGRDIAPLAKSVRALLQAEGIGFDMMSTNAAVRTYNVVLEEDRRVAAIMIAVDKAYG